MSNGLFLNVGFVEFTGGGQAGLSGFCSLTLVTSNLSNLQESNPFPREQPGSKTGANQSLVLPPGQSPSGAAPGPSLSRIAGDSLFS